jgi:DNA-binding transcriptional LysR family regulator
MDLDSVRYVVSLAEELHFGWAAQRHYIVPQAFGRRIQRLADWAGPAVGHGRARRRRAARAGPGAPVHPGLHGVRGARGDRALGQHGIRPDVAVETSQREAILPLVLAGAGAAVLPEAFAALAAGQGAVPVPFDPPLTRDLAVVRRPGPPTPPAAAFIAVAVGFAARRAAGERGRCE